MNREELTEHALRTLVIVLFTGILVVTILKYFVVDVKPKWVDKNTVELIPNPFFVMTIERYPMSVEVVNSTEKISIGVVTEPEIFRFGRINIGTQSRKIVTLSNPSSKDAKVQIYVFGNISNFTHAGLWNLNWTDQWEYILSPRSNKTIEIGVEGLEEGNFTGELVIVSRIPKIPMGGLIKWI